MPKQEDKTASKEDPGLKLLKQQFGQLSSSPTVWRSVEADLPRKDDTEFSTPQEAKDYVRAKNANVSSEARIAKFLERLERVIEREARNDTSESGYDRLQRRLLNAAVIDIGDARLVDKIAHRIFVSEKKIALERGHGRQTQGDNFEQVKEGYTKLVHEKHYAQLRSLSEWSDYLFKNDAQYPAWFRYLAIRSVLKMGDFDRDAPKFGNRTKDTIAAFPELNAEALGYVYKALSDPSLITPQTESLIEPFRAALASKNFSALYAVAVVECNQSIDRSRLEGEWRKYDKESDYTILEKDLSGKATGWCTASGSAESHLKGGDFYVYYTKDAEEKYSVPRVAIRMQGDEIAEIRGIAPRQELEPEFVDVVEEKGSTLPGYEKFKKASADMKQLTAIDKRCFKRDAEGNIKETLIPNPALSKEELKFLYEVESKISSFGYVGDPRVDQIKKARPDKKQDYATVYDFDIAQVAMDKGEITADTGVYVGDLNPQDYKILDGRKEPLIICGDVDLSKTPIASIPEGVVFNGFALFPYCKSLKSIPRGAVFNGKYAGFDGCTALGSICENVVFNAHARFGQCTALTSTPEGQVFNGDAFFSGSTSLTSIGKNNIFKAVTLFEGCTALHTIGEGTEFRFRPLFEGCTRLLSDPAKFIKR